MRLTIEMGDFYSGMSLKEDANETAIPFFCYLSKIMLV